VQLSAFPPWRLDLNGYVTAKIFASNKDSGNNSNTNKAKVSVPKAAAQAAFIAISASTPALTAPPMFFPVGSLIALLSGGKIIAENIVM
jgi:hypothetical protein